MPRPRRCRRVCCIPSQIAFGPLNGEQNAEPIALGVDEFEAIRLIDLNGLSQEECARRMDVARTTVQAIYASAREKVARCLVIGIPLTIGGGDYILCQGDDPGCPNCRAGRLGPGGLTGFQNGKENNMKVAVTYENGQIFQHFGHTEQFKIYDIQDGKVVAASLESTGGSGHGALASFLQEKGVDTLLCGGIGGGAKTALAQAGITLYGGVTGNADQAVEDLLAGKLRYDPNAVCSHHGEQHGHTCGEHGHDCHGHGHSGHHCGSKE